MDIETLKFGFQVLQFIATGAIGIYVYISNKNRVTNDRISTLENDIDTRLDGQSVRVAKLEEALHHAPTHDDLSKLHEKINDMSACMNRMEGEFKGNTRTLQLIHETMMERK